MKGLFTQRTACFKWMGLFAGAIILAIALANNLDSSKSLSLSVVEAPTAQVESLAGVNLDERDLAVQDRYGRRWIQYARVSRSDRSFRRMFIAADQVSLIEVGQPLPDNTLILMETWYTPASPGSVFIKQKLNGTWQYGSFSPAQPNYRVSDRGSCHSCHAPFPETDFTLTKPLLEAALQMQQLQTAHCDRAGRTPCAPEAYFPNSG